MLLNEKFILDHKPFRSSSIPHQQLIGQDGLVSIEPRGIPSQRKLGFRINFTLIAPDVERLVGHCADEDFGSIANNRTLRVSDFVVGHN
jgi:hypothetical protein